MRMKTEYRLYDDVNLTPLMDLAWNLMVAFVIVSTAAVQGIKVDLPKASAAPIKRGLAWANPSCGRRWPCRRKPAAATRQPGP